VTHILMHVLYLLPGEWAGAATKAAGGSLACFSHAASCAYVLGRLIAKPAAAETTQLWRRPRFSTESRALELFNELLDSYVNVLVDNDAHLLVPQYACLLRDRLMKATLRRYLLALTPDIEETRLSAVVLISRQLLNAASTEVRCCGSCCCVSTALAAC
jgi:hypothetical protein